MTLILISWTNLGGGPPAGWLTFEQTGACSPLEKSFARGIFASAGQTWTKESKPCQSPLRL